MVRQPIELRPEIRIRACAKINLFLRVLGRRADGYHDIETVFHGIGLCDEIDFRLERERGVRLRWELAEGTTGPLPDEGDDLVRRAADLLLEGRAGTRGAAVGLVKRIPIGAGLGGGSADGAGALMALNELWELALGDQELSDLAASLGSDVAYCLTGGTAIGRSRGEELSPLEVCHRLWFVLGISREPLWTRDVYERWEPHPAPEVAVADLAEALRTGDVAALAGALHNDLEAPAQWLRPDLRAKKDALIRAGARGACLSGSGPTVYGVTDDETHAGDVAARVEDAFDRVEVVASVDRCIERLA